MSAAIMLFILTLILFVQGGGAGGVGGWGGQEGFPHCGERLICQQIRGSAAAAAAVTPPC